jgi:beta-lactamase class A
MKTVRITIRWSSRIWLTVLLLTCTPTSPAQYQVRPDELAVAALQKLEREIGRLTSEAGGTVGVSAIHIESGRKVSLRGSERFPMASTFKVPVAVQLLHRVDDGEVRLDQMVDIQPGDLHPGSGTLTELFNKPGVSLSVRNLLELMLLISDNSGADLCMRLAGGPEAVTARMRALEIDQIDVSRSTALLIAEWAGVPDLPPESAWTPGLFRERLRTVTPEARKAAALKFDADPRDTSTPEAMRRLLERIYAKDLLKPASAELLLDIMQRCQTGEARLKGMLPDGTSVAHKTGTIGGTTNDVGIVTLPENAGHVAIAVFIKGSEKENSARERAIAQIGRSVYDFFLYQ